MCGILGIASTTYISKREWLASGIDNLAHRGPDSDGLWWSDDGKVGFAHRRLAILDLSPSGQQPMHDAASGLSIVFNGEIYNHDQLREELVGLGETFGSRSDTEVILVAYRRWGESCLSRLNGMFAFAIFDAKRGSVFLARDRAGEKPLFLHIKNKTLRFGSELKGLLADESLPRRANRHAVDSYLHTGYLPGDLCILDEFSKLPAAHALRFDLKTGAVKTWRYWDIPHPVGENEDISSLNTKNLLSELEGLLEASVARQLVADVPVGVLLSGGVDSSLVTAMAVRSSNNVRTFSVGFPGHGEFDETAHAKLIANYFGTNHTELVPEPTEPDLLFMLAKQYDEPIVDSSMIPTFLVSKLVRAHCTVALGGDGGDELFGGYTGYSRLLTMQKLLKPVPIFARKLLANLAGAALPVGFRGRNWFQALDIDLDTNLPVVSSFFDSALRKKLMSKYAPWDTVGESYLASRVPNVPNIVERATRFDFENYLAEDILVKVDRASMLNSLEIRAPFLDKDVIEFAFGRVPSRLKATEADRKIILKMLCSKVLPPEFDLHRKQGFSIPLAQWLKAGRLRQLFNDTLTSSDSLFSPDVVKSLLTGQDKGRSNSQRLFSMVMFELWRREYKVSIY
jgi:asparagine synthase (glutamine-hydrolysing)